MRKTILKYCFSIILIILLFGCDKAETLEISNPRETERNYVKNCDDYSSFYVNDNYYVQNNVWGFYAGSYTALYSQCIFYDSLQPSVFGWEWDLDSVSKFPSYPRVCYGWNPWYPTSTTDSLPKKLNTINSVIASFDNEFSSNGIYNTSFDIWLTDSIIPSEQKISAEIMIWLDGNNVPETALTIGNLLINNESYNFYKNTEWYPYPLLIFVKKTKTWNSQFDILPFLSFLLDNNHVPTESYLAAIEFGNEIWSGSGRMELMDYSIEVK